jgi:hypothetical protein
MIALLEIDFPDAGTRFYSFAGVATPNTWYKDQIISIGTITRQLPSNAVAPSFSDWSFELSNDDLEFSLLRPTNRFRGVKVRLRFGMASIGMNAVPVVASGGIYDWQLATTWKVTVRDSSYDRFRRLIGDVAKCCTVDVFPDMPIQTPPNLVPIIRGTAHSGIWNGDNQGAVPGYLIKIDATTPSYRYVLCQDSPGKVPTFKVYNVYVYGVPASPFDWTVWEQDYAGVRMRGIDINLDPRDPARAGEIEITADVDYFLDDGVGIFENPPKQLKELLETYGGLDESELNAWLWEAAADVAAFFQYYSDVVFTDRNMSIYDLIGFYGESFFLWVYTDREGKYAASVYTDAFPPDAFAAEISDENDILKSSFVVSGGQDVADNVSGQFLYKAIPGMERWDGNKSFPNAEGVTSGPWSLRCVREPNTPSRVLRRRLSLYNEGQDYLDVRLPPTMFSMDLNEYLKVTHFQGPATNGLGWQKKVVRIQEIAISAQPSEMSVRVRAQIVQAPSFTNPCPTEIFHVGDTFSMFLEAINGTPPFTFSILDNGGVTSLAITDGNHLQATFTDVGTFDWVVQVEDSNGAKGFLECQFIVAPVCIPGTIDMGTDGGVQGSPVYGQDANYVYAGRYDSDGAQRLVQISKATNGIVATLDLTNLGADYEIDLIHADGNYIYVFGYAFSGNAMQCWRVHLDMTTVNQLTFSDTGIPSAVVDDGSNLYMTPRQYITHGKGLLLKISKSSFTQIGRVEIDDAQPTWFKNTTKLTLDAGKVYMAFNLFNSAPAHTYELARVDAAAMTVDLITQIATAYSGSNLPTIGSLINDPGGFLYAFGTENASGLHGFIDRINKSTLALDTRYDNGTTLIISPAVTEPLHGFVYGGKNNISGPPYHAVLLRFTMPNLSTWEEMTLPTGDNLAVILPVLAADSINPSEIWAEAQRISDFSSHAYIDHICAFDPD